MSENVVADFTSRLTADTFDDPEPVTGRIVLSRTGLALVCSDAKLSIPLSAVFDISVGFVPQELANFFHDTVTIAYERGDSRHVAVIEGGSETVQRFTTLLFKAKLNGTKAMVKHPARVGGRVTDAGFRPASLRIRPGGVGFGGTDEPFAIDLSTVTHFEKEVRSVGGGSRSVLSVRHQSDGRMVTSEFAVSSERSLNLFGRYLRLEYIDLVEGAENIDVTEEEMEALVAVYSGGGRSTVANILGADANYASMVLDSLREKGLVLEGDDELALSTQGRMIVSDRIEDINM